MAREDCSTVEKALSSIRSFDEIKGYIDGLRTYGAPVTQDEWAEIARRRIELEQKERGRSK